ncbi:hypothetical protein ACJZ2D_016427 [Fusarium nematophilum]
MRNCWQTGRKVAVASARAAVLLRIIASEGLEDSPGLVVGRCFRRMWRRERREPSGGVQVFAPKAPGQRLETVSHLLHLSSLPDSGPGWRVRMKQVLGQERKGAGLKEIEAVILSVPQELDALYSQLTQSMKPRHKVDQLARLNKYDRKTRDAVQHHLSSNANDTSSGWHWPAKTSGRSHDGTLSLTSFVDILEDISDDLDSLEKIIGLCGSFLTLRDRTIYFVHQSAKDFLLTKVSSEIFSSGTDHYTVFSRSLLVMTSTLQRDMYDLHHPGIPIDDVRQPAQSSWSCRLLIGSSQR